jgi:DNA-binding GntR family transcriptional regulator
LTNLNRPTEFKVRLDVVDIGKTASASDIVFNALRKAIVEGDLADGAALRQDEIAKMFNTSRIPVREALTRLEEQGLVENRRYKGAVVAGITLDVVDEIFRYRMMLEGTVIKAAVTLMTDQVLDEARACCTKFATSTNASEWGMLNRQFHCTLYEASGLTYHMSMINMTLDRMDRYLRAQLSLTNGMKRAIQEHDQIFDACAKRDAELAASLTMEHVDGARESLARYLIKERGIVSTPYNQGVARLSGNQNETM